MKYFTFSALSDSVFSSLMRVFFGLSFLMLIMAASSLAQVTVKIEDSPFSAPYPENYPVILAPNPASSWVAIQKEADVELYHLEITDMYGNRIFETDIDPSQDEYFVPHINPGYHYFRLTTSEGLLIRSLVVNS